MHTIVQQDDNTTMAINDAQTVMVKGGKAFNRRAIRKNLRTGETEHLCVLVCELDGVRVYVDGDNIIVTKEDLNL